MLERRPKSTKEPELVKELTISCEGNHAAQKLFDLGKFEMRDPIIKTIVWHLDAKGLQKHPPMSRVVQIRTFEGDPTDSTWNLKQYAEVLVWFKRLGLGQPTCEDYFCFGEQHPKESKHGIIFFQQEEMFHPLGAPVSLIWDSVGTARWLRVEPSRGPWAPTSWFAAIRPSE